MVVGDYYKWENVLSMITVWTLDVGLWFVSTGLDTTIGFEEEEQRRGGGKERGPQNWRLIICIFFLLSTWGSGMASDFDVVKYNRYARVGSFGAPVVQC